MSPVAAAKALLRDEQRVRLAAIDPCHGRGQAERVAERVLELPEVAKAKRLLVCLSFGTEIDTWHLVDRMLAEGRELFVPRADPRDGRLHVHPYPCPLRTLPFGLQQPPRGAPEMAAAEIDGALDAVLVLGLAFDRRGYRLGYGSGYFDRFLAGRPFPAIGLAFSAQLLDAVPAEPHDVPMAVVVTPDGVWRPATDPAAAALRKGGHR